MKTILFVCVHNSGRSQMAEAFLNRMAKGKARAISAGTEPGTEVNPVVVQAMREIGIDLSGQKPKGLTPGMVDQADRVVTMGCGASAVCPATWIPTEDWELDDPHGQTIEKVREIRDEIKRRIETLLNNL